MAYSIANNHLLRKNFATIKNIIDIPNLIDIQKNSYRRFLQSDVPLELRKNIGLEAVFRSVFLSSYKAVIPLAPTGKPPVIPKSITAPTQPFV